MANRPSKRGPEGCFISGDGSNLVDLSHTWHAGMSELPFFPPLEITPFHTFENDGIRSAQIRLMEIVRHALRGAQPRAGERTQASSSFRCRGWRARRSWLMCASSAPAILTTSSASRISKPGNRATAGSRRAHGSSCSLVGAAAGTRPASSTSTLIASITIRGSTPTLQLGSCRRTGTLPALPLNASVPKGEPQRAEVEARR